MARATSVAAGLLAALVCCLAYGYVESAYYNDVGVEVDQPVPFSHEHHVGRLKLDCRYCHTSVETSAFAGMPATQVCMGCHAQLWTDAEMLLPVRESWRTGRPIVWQRVHDLPDFVYFDHSVHIAKGVACMTCHGRVDRMPLMRKAATLQMRWCVDCHRDPVRRVGSRERVFEMEDGGTRNSGVPARIEVAGLTDCSACHR